MNDVLMELKDISQVFNQNFVALKDIHITVNKGECLGIVGESGCGKSTLGKIMSLIDQPFSGHVYYQDQFIQYQAKELYALRKEIQYIFQDPLSAFLPKMKIKTFLLEPFVNFHICSKKEALKQIEDLLLKVGLDKQCLNKYPHQLSGGQLQRIVIARAISLSPKLLICDEITSALDVISQNEILKLIKDLQQQSDLTLIFISHDLSLVSRFCHRVFVMKDGQEVECLPSSQLRFSHHPYTKNLINSVLSIHDIRN